MSKKDPAFLFYSHDFFLGTATMSFEDRGKYITILSLMHQQGRLKEDSIKAVIGTISESLKSKFKIDDSGLWFNSRLEEEIENRRKFVETRRGNGGKGGRPKKQKPLGYPNGKPLGGAEENANENKVIYNNDAHYSAEEVKKIITEQREFLESAVKALKINEAEFKNYAGQKIAIWEPVGYLTKYPLGTIKRIFLEDYPKWAKEQKPVKEIGPRGQAYKKFDK